MSTRVNYMPRDRLLNLSTTLELVNEQGKEYFEKIEQELEGLKQNISQVSKQLESLTLQPSTAPARDTDTNKDTMDVLLRLVKKLHSTLVNTSFLERVLAQLWFPSLDARQDNVRDATDGTFEWILDEKQTSRPSNQMYNELLKRENERENARSSLESWLRADSSIFHISGKAGSGKSTLVKYVAHHDNTQQELKKWAASKSLVKSSFYFWRESNLSMPLEGFYRTILYETLLQTPYIARSLFPEQWTKLSGCPNSIREPDERLFRYASVEKAFKRLTMLSESSSHRFCYFIDGLDEFKGTSEEQWVLAKDLNTWAQAPGVKILTSARPHMEFLGTFRTPGNVIIDLAELNTPDIYTFTSTELESSKELELSSETSGSTSKQREENDNLARDISWQSEGVFLWAVLVVRLLKTSMRFRDPPDVQREKLVSIPKDLNKLYQELLESIDPIDVPRSNRLLLVATNNPSSTPLYFTSYRWIEDLHKDLEFPREHDFVRDSRESWGEDFTYQLDLLTRGLLQISFKTGTVELYHKTVRDFLSTEEKQCELRRSFPDFPLRDFYVLLDLCDISSSFERVISTCGIGLDKCFDTLLGKYKTLSSTTLETMDQTMQRLAGKEYLSYHVWFVHAAAYYHHEDYVIEQVQRDRTAFTGMTTHNLLLSALQENWPTFSNLFARLIGEGFSLTDTISSQIIGGEASFPVWMVATFNVLSILMPPPDVNYVFPDGPPVQKCFAERLNFLLREGAPLDALLAISSGPGSDELLDNMYKITLADFANMYEEFVSSHSRWVRTCRNTQASNDQISPEPLGKKRYRAYERFSPELWKYDFNYHIMSIEHNSVVMTSEYRKIGFWRKGRIWPDGNGLESGFAFFEMASR